MVAADETSGTSTSIQHERNEIPPSLRPGNREDNNANRDIAPSAISSIHLSDDPIDHADSAPEVAEPAPTVSPSLHYHHRSLSPALSQESTSIVSTWLTSPLYVDQGKEVAHSYPYGSPELASKGDDLWRSEQDQTVQGSVELPSPDEKRIYGLKVKTFWIRTAMFITILVLLAIGLGIGLWFGLPKKKGDSAAAHGDPLLSVGGAIDPAYYSKSGAFNGTGIAFAGAALRSTNKGEYSVYYQHHSGQIRYLQLMSDNKFVGGTASEVVAFDARNNTPISVVQYVFDTVATWHVFYIGKDDFVKQRTWRNTSSLWSVRTRSL